MKLLKIVLNQFGYILLLVVFFSFYSLNAQQLAFPTAKGAGAYATGGRGGQVIHVTTLDWDAPGGLLEAIQTPGPRIIVFDVSGEIDATEQWIFTPIIQGSAFDNITIAGQTAPEGGITIKVSEFMFQNVNNIIIRYIRFRQMTDGTQDPMWFISTSNVILDHCTFSHGADEGMDLSASSGVMGDVTVQNCFFQDSKTGSILGIDDVEGDFTFINNVYSNISHRFPNPKGEGHYDIINNIVYNWKNRLIRITGGGTYNVINNYYKPSVNGLRLQGWFGDGHINWLQKIQTQAHDNPLVYSSGSIVVGQRETPLDDDSDMWTNFAGSHLTVGEQSPSQYFTSSQFPIVGASYEFKTADQAYIDILNDVGANKTLNADGSILQFSDSKDVADILMIQNDSYSGSFYDDRNTIPHPTIPHNTRPSDFDTNNDGMPDTWKILKGFDVNEDLSNYEWASGYIGIEEYLNEIDKNIDDIEVVDVTNVEITPETASVNVEETIELDVVFLPETATNHNGTWSSSDDSIATVDLNGTVTGVEPGTVTITFTSYNDITDTSEITVLPEALQASAGTDQEICEGESITLTASGGVNYVWSTGETTESIEVTPDITTTYTVTVSDEYDQSEEASVVVTVNTIPIADAGEDQTICLGDIVTLTATGGTSFIWSNGETTASIEVSPIEETVYSVEVIDNNCSSITEVTVFINDLPNIIVNEHVVIVEGESTMLTASGSDNYEWSTGETTDSITVSPTETTTYFVSTVGVNGCSNSVNVTVIVIPEIVAYAGEDITICNGDTVSLIATGGSTYTWDTGDVGPEIFVSPTTTTTYTVTAEDEYGYTNTDSVTVFVNEIPNISAGEDVFIMIGNSATLTANGGVSYSWNTGEETAQISVSPEVTTTYTVIGESENGCQNTVEVTVTVVEVLAANAGDDKSICIGDSITLSASGGTGYIWNTGDEGAFLTVTPTETTTYSVTVTDDYGNSDIDDVTITVNPIPTVYAGEDQITCQNESVILTATAMDGDSYLWSTGETTDSIIVNPNEDTIYTVEVSNGICSHSDDVAVYVLQAPEITITEDIIIMEGNSTVLNVSGGDSYLWSTGEITSVITVSPIETTTYYVNAFIENGCENTEQVTVTVVPQVFAEAGDDISICKGESITLNAVGSTNFLWNTGQTSASITVNPMETTTYTVEVSDDFGNSESDSVTVLVNELPNITVSENIIIFEGESTELTVEGADTYLWSTDETSSSILVSPLETTIYTVTGFSESGCQTSVDVTVTVIPEVIANAGDDVEICIGESVTLTASGSLNYFWSTGETSASITLSPTETTTYTVTVSDNYGNTESDDVTVTVKELPILTISEDVTVFEGESTELSVVGAETYLWSTDDTSNSILVTPTVNTTYTVTGYSVNGCQTTAEVTVSVIPEVIADAGNNVSICSGDSITLTASGSSNFSWNTGETSESITVSPLATTTYTVTVSDDYGNSDTDSVTIMVNELSNLIVSEDITIFEGESTTLTANGAETYLWNTGETTNSIVVNPLETTTYLVNGFSVNACQVTEEITVTVIPELEANAGINETICFGDSVILTASGGSSYSWNTGQTSASIIVNPAETTTYTVTVIDDYGNTDSDSVIVTVTEIPIVSVSGNTTIFEGESTTLTANGAHVYLWSTGQNSSSSITVSPAQTTTYSVVGFTPNSCQSEELQFTVTVIPEVIANAGNDVSICIGESVTLNASGGSNYSWNTGDTVANPTFTPTETTTYTVTVSDDLGNSDTDSVTVTVNELPSITVSENITIFEGESTNLIADGAETYLWSTGDSSGSIVVSPLETTTYMVTGFSANGCETTAQVEVTVIPEVIANAGNNVSICIGESVTLNASGGTSYIWNTGGSGANPTFTPTETTTYTVTVSDDYGNSDTDSVTVTVNEIPVITASENITIVEGESTTLSVNGAETYLWSTGDTSNSIVVSPTQTTTYTVIGSTNTCSSDVVEVVVTVTPVFLASAGEDAYVCDNQTYEVTLTANEGDSYLWSTGETTQSIVVSPLSTTSYTVTVFNNGQEDTDDVMVHVDPSPEVVIANGDSVEILNGDFVTLSASGANTYEWSNGATQPNIAVSPSTTTTYEVKGYIGDCYDEKLVTVNVFDYVNADAGEDVVICLNEMTTLTATGGDEYVWSTGETTPTIQVSPDVTTDYTVTVFNPLDFDEATVRVEIDTDCIAQTTDPTDIPKDFKFNLYPNPADDQVNIKFSGVLVVSDLHIYDVTGKLIQRTQISNENISTSSTIQVDISSLQSGVYFVKFIGEETDVTKKLIVE